MMEIFWSASFCTVSMTRSPALEIFKNICAEFSEKNDLKIKLLHEDQSQIAGIIKRLTKEFAPIANESPLPPKLFLFIY